MDVGALLEAGIPEIQDHPEKPSADQAFGAISDLKTVLFIGKIKKHIGNWLLPDEFERRKNLS